MADSISEKGQENVLIIPDYKIAIVTSFLEMIYTGKTLMESENDFAEMKQFGFKLLGFYMGLNMNVELDMNRTFLKTLQPAKKTTAIEINADSLIDCNVPNKKYKKSLNSAQDEVLFANPYLTSSDTNLSEDESNIPSITCSLSDNSRTNSETHIDAAVSEEEMPNEESNSLTPDLMEFFVDTSVEIKEEDLSQVPDLNDPEIFIQTKEQDITKTKREQKEWECYDCNQKLPTKSALILHSLETHNERRPFVCSLCPNRYRQLAHLKSHHKSMHLKLKDVVCDKCGKKFGCQSELRKHLRNLRSCINTPKKRYVCHFCHAKFTSKDGLNRHCKRIHPKANLEQRLSENSSNSDTLKEEKGGKETDFQIPDNNGFWLDSFTTEKAKTSKNSGNEASIINSNGKETPKNRPELKEWECYDCSEKLLTKNELIHHSLETHNEKSPFVCSLCPNRYRQLAHLSSHHKIMHLKLKDVICDKCGKNFGCQSELRKHLKNLRSCNTTTKKRYICHLCPNKFTSRDGLNKHCKRIHSKANFGQRMSDNPSNIDIVSEEVRPNKETDSQIIEPNSYLHDSFTTKATKSIKNSGHETKTLSSKCETNEQEKSKKTPKKREWECTTCFEKLPTKNEMIHHNLEIHNETKPFVCSLCTKRYTVLCDLENHHKISHLNELDFTCEKCGKKFGYKHKLERHIKMIRSCNNPKMKI